MLLNAEWPATDLALAIDGIDRNALVKEYEDARKAAPRRHDQGRSYFVPGHNGRLRGDAVSGCCLSDYFETDYSDCFSRDGAGFFGLIGFYRQGVG